MSLEVDESEDLVIHLYPDYMEADIAIHPSDELLRHLIKELNPEAYHEQPARAEINTVVEEIKKHLKIVEEETEETEEEEKKEE